jgi:hypothetical protein
MYRYLNMSIHISLKIFEFTNSLISTVVITATEYGMYLFIIIYILLFVGLFINICVFKSTYLYLYTYIYIRNQEKLDCTVLDNININKDKIFNNVTAKLSNDMTNNSNDVDLHIDHESINTMKYSHNIKEHSHRSILEISNTPSLVTRYVYIIAYNIFVYLFIQTYVLRCMHMCF